MTDLLSADEAREYLGRGIADATKQPVLAHAITMASGVLEQRIGPVLYGTITAEAHDGSGNVLYTKYRPVVQVTQIVEYDGITAGTLTAESNTAKPDSSYFVDLTAGRIIRRNAGADAIWAAGRGNVLIDYVAGHASGTIVPERYKFATGMILKANWRAFENAVTTLGEYDVPQASFPSFSVPKMVREMLADEWQAGSGTGD